MFLGLVSAVLLGVVARFLGVENALVNLLKYFIGVNCLLAVFNLIPVPPLDGSWLLDHLLRGQAYIAYRAFKPYGMLVLIGILMFPPISGILIYTPWLFLSNAMFSVSDLILGAAA